MATAIEWSYAVDGMLDSTESELDEDHGPIVNVVHEPAAPRAQESRS